MFCGFFKPKFYKKCKYSIKIIKIRLDILKRKKNATVFFLNTDIVEILKTSHEHNNIAYNKVEVLLEELSILSSYDLIERFCDSISSNLSLMLKQRECPEECREAVSSLMYAAAWVRNVPELKELRALFTRRYRDSFDSYVNQELVEKLVWRKPSCEVMVHTLQEIAQESKIIWDPISLIKHTSALQIEQKEMRKIDKGANDRSVDELVLSQSLRRRESVNKKKIWPYGSISPPYTKQGGRKGEDEKKENKKSVDQENSRLLGPQGNESFKSIRNKEASSTKENKRTSSFQSPKFLDYDEVVNSLAAAFCRKEERSN